MTRSTPIVLLAGAATAALALVVLVGGCEAGDSGGGAACGPATEYVKRVIDGDTIELDDGTRVRYLLIDTPETTGGKDDCFGREAVAYNESLVLDQQITLRYDVECEDHYDRLLAYVSVQDREVNLMMVERGYACVLHIPPNGDDRKAEFAAAEATARAERRGMWGVCEEIACD